MKKLFFSLLILMGVHLAASGQSPLDAQPRTFEMQEGDTTYTMKRYVMVLLWRGEQAFDYSEAELEKLQAGHMENIGKIESAGKLVMAGPFGDDTKLRGIFILDVENTEEAQKWVEPDPAIQAGRLKAEYHPWWGAVGTTLK